MSANDPEQASRSREANARGPNIQLWHGLLDLSAAIAPAWCARFIGGERGLGKEVMLEITYDRVEASLNSNLYRSHFLEAGVLLSPHAFIHVPILFGKIVEPEKSTFRVSLATFEDWDRRAAQAGYGVNWRRSHENREATRSAALAGRLNDDLWVFAYGSLMWDPAIHIVEIRRATLRGFHRRFCLKAEIGRGSKEAPALMAALDLGGVCHGLAFRIPANAVNHETEILWMREMIGEAYVPFFQTVLTPQGSVEALAFVMDRASPRFADLSGAEAAAIIATGKGVLGTNLEYFDNLADHVAVLGIEDEVFEAIRSQLHRRG